jgi:hypothetical protein
VVAENVAVVAFARMVTDVGIVRTPVIPPVSVTDAPPLGAALVAVTVHRVPEFDASVVLRQEREESSTGADNETVALLEEPLREAVSVAVWSVETVVVEMGNVAVVAPAAMVADVGTVRTPDIPPESVTAEPPVGAALFDVIVHAVFPLDVSVAAVQEKEEIRTGADSATVAVLEDPLRDALTVAV